MTRPTEPHGVSEHDGNFIGIGPAPSGPYGVPLPTTVQDPTSDYNSSDENVFTYTITNCQMTSPTEPYGVSDHDGNFTGIGPAPSGPYGPAWARISIY